MVVCGFVFFMGYIFFYFEREIVESWLEMGIIFHKISLGCKNEGYTTW